jgi:hypothetical protein
MDAKTQVNVNQLTTQAIFAANGQASLDALYKDWDKQNSVVTANIKEGLKKHYPLFRGSEVIFNKVWTR